MTTPGTTSGTYQFSLDNFGIVIEAYDRIGLRPPDLGRHHLISARTSLNLEMQSISNRGFNLWELATGTIALVAGQGVYTLPTTLVDLTAMWYTTVDTSGGPNSTDRIMLPLTRDQYSMLSQKYALGTPLQYWFQRLQVPQVTLWQPPSAGAPDYVCNWYGVQRLQDAGLASGETPDIVYRGLDALCALMAVRLARKFRPEPQLLASLKEEAAEAFGLFAANDQEGGPMIMQPNISGYARI